MKPLFPSCSRPALSALRGNQAGIVLVVALIALVAITLAAVTLVRSIDTGLEIAGNMAFKEAGTTAADVATDEAVKWLVNNKSTLNSSVAASAYFANWMAGCDMTGNRTSTKTDDVGWPPGIAGVNCKDPIHSGPTGTAIAVSLGMPPGFSASFIITRMCFCDGPAAGYCPTTSIENSCVGVTGRGRFHETPTYENRGLSGAEAGRVAAGLSPYYRIVTRVAGPRNTVSYVETMVTLDN
jgi:type IV pilus assembly protein PilX